MIMLEQYLMVYFTGSPFYFIPFLLSYHGNSNGQVVQLQSDSIAGGKLRRDRKSNGLCISLEKHRWSGKQPNRIYSTVDRLLRDLFSNLQFGLFDMSIVALSWLEPSARWNDNDLQCYLKNISLIGFYV